MAVEFIKRPIPHYTFGYSGHCPQYQYTEEILYGQQTHRFTCKPIKFATVADVKVEEPEVRQIFKLVKPDLKHLFNLHDPHDMTPYYENPGRDVIIRAREAQIYGYEGHIPGLKLAVGQSYGRCSIDAKSYFRRAAEVKLIEPNRNLSQVF